MLVVIALCTGSLNGVLAQESAYEITVTVKNFQDSVLYLGYPYGDKKYLQDTAFESKPNTFVFTGEKPLDGGLYFIYNPKNIYFDFVVSESEFELSTDTTDLIGAMQVKHSEENQAFFDFQRFMRDKQQEAQIITEKLKQEKDSTTMAQLQAELSQIDEEVKTYRQQIIDRQPTWFVASFIKATMQVEVPEAANPADPNYRYHYYKSHFFDNINFSDARMLRTPIFHSKIDEYLEKLTPKHPDSVAVAARRVIELARANDDVFRYTLVTLANKYETSNVMGMDAVFVDLSERYYLKGDAFWADSALVAKIAQRVRELKPTLLGSPAPAMHLVDTAMRAFNLRQIKSDYLVLYFYDPDCGHCKKKTPELLKLYNETLRERGVKVVAANINKDVDEWKNYIKKNDLNWINGADPNYHSNFRAEYNIDSTPKIFILDEEKKVIAKRLDVDQIDEFITRQIEIASRENHP